MAATLAAVGHTFMATSKLSPLQIIQHYVNCSWTMSTGQVVKQWCVHHLLQCAIFTQPRAEVICILLLITSTAFNMVNGKCTYIYRILKFIFVTLACLYTDGSVVPFMLVKSCFKHLAQGLRIWSGNWLNDNPFHPLSHSQDIKLLVNYANVSFFVHLAKKHTYIFQMLAWHLQNSINTIWQALSHRQMSVLV